MRPITETAFAEVAMPGQLKPRGDKLAFLLRQANLDENRYDNRLWLLEGDILRPLETCGPVANFWWKDEDCLVFTRPPEVDTKKAEGTQLYALSLQHSAPPTKFLCLLQEVEDLAFLPNGGLLFLAPAQNAPLPLGGVEADRADYEVVTELPFWENGGGFTAGRRQGLWLWQKGKSQCLTPPHTSVETFCLQAGGRRALFFGSSATPLLPLGCELYELDTQSGTITALPLPAKPFNLYTLALAENGSLLLFGSDTKTHGLNQNGAFYLRAPGAAGYRLLYGGGAYTAASTVNCDTQFTAPEKLHCQGDKAFFISTEGASAHLMSIDLQTGIVQAENTAAGSISELACLQKDILFVALRGLLGPELYRQKKNGEARLSAWNQPFARTYACQVPEELWAQNPDGTRVQGWVLRPTGWAQEGCYPAVLCIHGGPKTVWGTVFHHEIQYLAGRGLAVLFCNPRGSDGRGDDFADIRGGYGGVDAADILAFLDAALARYPWLDGQQLGIMGGSYGGYMVNWLIGHSRRFKAAVSQRGIANWMSMAALSDIGRLFVPDQAVNPWQNPEAAFENSPLKYAKEVRTPTLFLHSDEDYRCPLPESMQMYAALMQQGVPTRLCIFKGESHELSRSGKPRHRVARLREISGWLEKWLAPLPGENLVDA